MQTIGAGGGSIARVDEAGGVPRRPAQRRARDPGPPCYGLGGDRADDHRRAPRPRPPGRRALPRRRDEPAPRRRRTRPSSALASRLGMEPAGGRRGRPRLANANMAQTIRSITDRARPRPARLQPRRLRRRGPAARGRAAPRGWASARSSIPPHPGITSAAGLLTSRPALRPDAHGLHARGLDRRRRDQPQLRGARGRARASAWRATARDPARCEVERYLDCRYVGQGYELRIPVGPRASVPTRPSQAFHAAHRDEYGHAFDDPVEIVNLRVTVRGPRARGSSASNVESGDGRGARRAGPGRDLARRRPPRRAAHAPPRLRERARRSDEPVAGPAILFQRDTTIVVPTGMGGHRHRREGALLLTHDGDGPRTAHERHRRRRRPDHRRRSSAARSPRSRSTWATAWRACRTRRSSASPRTSAARSATTSGRQLCESTQSTPLQSGPLARLPAPGSTGASRRWATSGARATSWCTTTPTTAPPTSPTSRFAVPIFLGDELDRLLRDDRAPPRPRRAHARAAAASSTRPTRAPRGSCSTRSRSRRRGGRCERLAHHRRQHAPARSSSSATWRPRWPPRKLGADAHARARASAYGLEHGPARRPSSSWTSPSGRCAAEIEKLPDGRYEAEGMHGRLPRPPRPGLPRTWPIKVGRDGHRLRPARRPRPGTSPPGRPADQHAARRHGGHRGLHDAAGDPARHRRATTPCPRTRGCSGRSRSRRRWARSPTRASRRRRSRASVRATSSPTRSCARWPRCCPTRWPPASATSRSWPSPVSDRAARGSTWTSSRAATAAVTGKDGLDAVDTLYANTRNNPIEDIESHYPLRVTALRAARRGRRRRALARRPGLDPRVRVPRGRRLLARGRRQRDRRRPGCSAAATGARARSTLNPGTPDEAPLPSKIPYRRVRARGTCCAWSPPAAAATAPRGA